MKKFWRKVDKRKRQEMIDFLEDHDSHSDHRGPERFANCIKIHHLGLPPDVQVRALDFLENSYIWQDELGPFLEERRKELGLPEVWTEGRSGGWLVLDQKKWDWRPYEEWHLYDLQWLADMVQKFDQLTDELVREFLDLLPDGNDAEEIETGG